MSSYNKVRENAAHTRIALLTATFRIGLKSSSRQSPYLLWQLQINPDSSFLKKGADECLGATRRRDQLCKYWGGGDQSPPIKGAIQSGLCSHAQRESLSHKAITTFVSTAVVIVPSSLATIL